LKPDLDPLFKRVLTWAPNHTGTFPPDTKQEDFKRVAATFTSSVKYAETFEPLLMLECWQHILQARMESLGESFDFMIENRQKVDDYVELFVTMKPTTYTNVGLFDPDLVILSNRQGPGAKECFARVHGVKKKKDSVELSLRCIPSGDMASLLVPKAQMFGVKLFRYQISGFC
jgi:senataxin